MPSRKLVHHLRSYRKTFGLSQNEVARLLGSRQGSNVCRYERFRSVPSLQTAIAYEIIFKASLADLLPDLYAEVRELISRRARTLLKKMANGSQPSQESKLAFFESLATVTTDDIRST
jgi:transcriptional regulator with XRE-family HTH domain